MKFVVIFIVLVEYSFALSLIKPKDIFDEDVPGVLVNRPKIKNVINGDYIRRKRYLGVSKTFKLNRRYQECVAPGDVKGHCKHRQFCPLDFQKRQISLNYMCVIEKVHVGVCCPDDIALSGYDGELLIQDLPGGGYDYENSTTTGCGLPEILRGSGGVHRAENPEWPWLAALYLPGDASGQQFCGGSIITDKHILTASHCTAGLEAGDIMVRLGEYNFRVSNETRSMDFKVVKITQHENYVGSTYANDIAILRLERSAPFNSYIWPVCLPPRNMDYSKIANKNAIVAGWGLTSYRGYVSPLLLEVAIPIWPQDKCEEAFLEAVNDNNICAAGFEGGKDACAGDSGGPLNFQLDNGRWVIIGIVSWGDGCGKEGKPGVYTKVSNYLPWIIQHTIAE